jgi:hypothetical protein
MPGSWTSRARVRSGCADSWGSPRAGALDDLCAGGPIAGQIAAPTTCARCGPTWRPPPGYRRSGATCCPKAGPGRNAAAGRGGRVRGGELGAGGRVRRRPAARGEGPRLVAMRRCRARCIDACRGLAEHLRRAQRDFYRRTARETEDMLPTRSRRRGPRTSGASTPSSSRRRRSTRPRSRRSVRGAGRWRARGRRSGSTARRSGSSCAARCAGRRGSSCRTVACSGRRSPRPGPRLRRFAGGGRRSAMCARRAVDQAHRALEQRWHGRQRGAAARARFSCAPGSWAAGAVARVGRRVGARLLGAVQGAGLRAAAGAATAHALFEEVVRPLTAPPARRWCSWSTRCATRWRRRCGARSASPGRDDDRAAGAACRAADHHGGRHERARAGERARQAAAGDASTGRSSGCSAANTG